jgi:diguanylate cyclase
MLGMALAGLFIARVLYEHQAPWGSWAMLLFTAVFWPQLARWRSRKAADPRKAELDNLLFDTALAGLWAALMHFSLLPSALLITLALVDKLNTGVRNLWLRALPAMLAGLLVGVAFTGGAVNIDTSTAVTLACMPMLIIHTTAVALNGYFLVRRVQRQNRQLEELSRTDVLTGLSARRHWPARAEELLGDSRRSGTPASLLLLDIDEFKLINDRHGHTLGDDVLCRVAEVLSDEVGLRGHVGRIGGDEFAAALAVDLEDGLRIGRRICETVAALRVPEATDLHCSVSCGVAAAGRDIDTLRDWMIAADIALYRAKHGGRGQVQSSEVAVRR